TFQCSLDGAAFTVCASPKSYTGLTAGWHVFRVRAVDRAGNVDASPETAYWYVNVATDTTPPETTITAQPSALTSPTGATFTFSSEAGAKFACKLDAAGYTSCNSPTGLSGLKDGSHTFSVRATDAAGNTDQTAASFDWTVDTVAPAVSFTDQPASPTNKT